MTYLHMTTLQEADLLSRRTGLTKRSCYRWMRARNIASIPDLMHRYPGKTHAECQAEAVREIEDFVLGGG